MKSGFFTFILTLSFCIGSTIPGYGQDQASLSAYLCKSYNGFKFNEKFLPVKYVTNKWPREISSKEAWRLDSLYTYSDTIYFDDVKLNEMVSQDVMTQKESEEIMKSLISNSKLSKTSSLECIPTSPKGRSSTDMISFSQPAFTKDKTKCLVTYDIRDPLDTNPKALRSRQTFVFKWEGGKWVDAQFFEMEISELGD